MYKADWEKGFVIKLYFNSRLKALPKKQAFRVPTLVG